ncbi:MAG: hypothetical protein H6518_00955 [Microthrixaceae bacterium]|nr:hypothetical protein [Microthrixaceae bacterium]
MGPVGTGIRQPVPVERHRPRVPEVGRGVPRAPSRPPCAWRAATLLAEVRLFDVFRGLRSGTGPAAWLYTPRFQAPDRTLTDAEVGEARSRLIEAVAGAHGATLR